QLGRVIVDSTRNESRRMLGYQQAHSRKITYLVKIRHFREVNACVAVVQHPLVASPVLRASDQPCAWFLCHASILVVNQRHFRTEGCFFSELDPCVSSSLQIVTADTTTRRGVELARPNKHV